MLIIVLILIMRIKRYLFHINIDDMSVLLQLYSPIVLNRNKRKKYLLLIKYAFINLKNLCRTKLDFELESIYIIKLSLRILHDRSGEYCPITKKISIDAEYLIDIFGFEETFFHELLHFIFYDFFSINYPCYINYLTEGFVVFFENIYYPDNVSRSSILFEDRINVDLHNGIDHSIAPGYYFTERLYNDHLPELKKYLKDNKIFPVYITQLENLIMSMVDDESNFFDSLIVENTDIIICGSDVDHNDEAYVAIYRRSQMDAPIILKIEQEILKRIKDKYIIITEDIGKFESSDFIPGIIPEDLYYTVSLYYAEACKVNPEIEDAVGKRIIYSC